MTIVGSTEEILKFMGQYLPSDPIVIEAGGYNGDDSVKLSQHWPKGKIHSFEPVPTLYEQLKSKTSCYSNIFTYPFALSDHCGQAIMYLAETYKRPGQICGSSSLLRPFEHLVYDDAIHFVDETLVETITLDEWANAEGIPKIDFLWLDMQGHELSAIRNSKIVKTAQAIYTEVSFIEMYKDQYQYKDIKKWMQENGFTLITTDFQENLIEENLINHNWYFGNAFFAKI